MSEPRLSAPIPLVREHDRSDFDCGEPSLNAWLQNRAWQNEQSGPSRTYVICADPSVIGYYSLSAGALLRDAAPKRLQRNAPDPIPVVLLGRLAVDRRHQGQGIGKALLQDAILRVLQAAQIIGVSILVVEAISVEAKRFYVEYGFIECPTRPMTLCLPLAPLRARLSP
jgi:GNAT superfamily N-acetyltransferase